LEPLIYASNSIIIVQNGEGDAVAASGDKVMELVLIEVSGKLMSTEEGVDKFKNCDALVTSNAFGNSTIIGVVALREKALPRGEGDELHLAL